MAVVEKFDCGSNLSRSNRTQLPWRRDFHEKDGVLLGNFERSPLKVPRFLFVGVA